MDNENQINKLIQKTIRFEKIKEKPNFSDKVADRVATFGGSWTFIFFYIIFVFIWIIINLFSLAFDPPPFILLNLLLSCLAVFQTPFVLMSQNRLHQIDRQREERDHLINIKTELEVKQLFEKMDELINETRANRTNKSI